MRTALVLSAGGMFGAYQAGAWEVLSRVWRPDVVVGASIGALNGWAIAGGCSPAELCDRWLHLEESVRWRWQVPRSPLDGVLREDLLEQWARQVHREFTPQVEYGTVLTEWRRLQPRLFRHPEITWRHLAASCAAPVVFRQYRIGDALYSDGGLLNPRPVWAAQAMGAERVVCINVMPDAPLLVRTAVRAARWMGTSAPRSEWRNVVMLEPQQPLGGSRHLFFWGRERAERWLEQGRRDAEAILPHIRAQFASTIETQS